jgi:ABC-type multidrug transport system ATPase subunit
VAVLHDLNLAAAFADRIIVLHGGAVVADGPARAAITTDMLGRVFDVCAAPGQAPADGMPFVLPQMMTARDRSARQRRPDGHGEPEGATVDLPHCGNVVPRATASNSARRVSKTG